MSLLPWKHCFYLFCSALLRWALLLSHIPLLSWLGQDLILDQTCSGPKPLSQVVLSFEIIHTQGVCSSPRSSPTVSSVNPQLNVALNTAAVLSALEAPWWKQGYNQHPLLSTLLLALPKLSELLSRQLPG